VPAPRRIDCSPDLHAAKLRVGGTCATLRRGQENTAPFGSAAVETWRCDATVFDGPYSCTSMSCTGILGGDTGLFSLGGLLGFALGFGHAGGIKVAWKTDSTRYCMSALNTHKPYDEIVEDIILAMRNLVCLLDIPLQSKDH
jgi:hypothetical protein